MGTVTVGWRKKIKNYTGTRNCSICGRRIEIGEKYLSVVKEPTPNKSRKIFRLCVECDRSGIEKELFPEDFDWVLDLKTNTWTNKETGKIERYGEEELEE